MPSKCLVLVAAVAVALLGCSGDDGEEDAAPTTRPTSGCPIAAAVVAEAVAHPVAIERQRAPGSCAYVGEGAAAGSRVEVSVRSLADETFADVLAAVERRAGPTVLLAQGDVDGAERGWVATVGRAVQVGAAAGEVLAVVAVTDPLLDADAALEVAKDLAGEALSG